MGVTCNALRLHVTALCVPTLRTAHPTHPAHLPLRVRLHTGYRLSHCLFFRRRPRDFSGWSLRGPIPEALGTAFPMLTRVALERNRFSGAFPPGLKALSSSKLTTLAASFQVPESVLSAGGVGLSESDRTVIAAVVAEQLGTSLLDVYEDVSGWTGVVSLPPRPAPLPPLPPLPVPAVQVRGASPSGRRLRGSGGVAEGLIIYVLCASPGEGGCSPELPLALSRGLQIAMETLAAANSPPAGTPGNSGASGGSPQPTVTQPAPPPRAISFSLSVSLPVDRIVTADGNEITDCRVTDDVSDCAALLEIHLAWERLWPAFGSTSMCGWTGVECDPDNRVVGLSLPSMRPPLQGTIPEAVGRLPLLRRIDLSGNALRGTLPASLRARAATVGSAVADTWRLSGNRLSDCGPLDVLESDCAQLLAVSRNWSVWVTDGGSPFCGWAGVNCTEDRRVSGISLPAQTPPLAGSLPAALGALPFLRSLNVTGNDLVGTVPAELKAAARSGQLAEWALSGNRLRDCGLRDDPGECSALLAVNQTWGGLWTAHGGSSFCSWPYLVCTGGAEPPGATGVSARRVSRLEMSGERGASGRIIPPEIGRLSSLEVLDLRLNNLTGRIPADLANLTKATVLLLSNNSLVGALPNAVRALISSSFRDGVHLPLTYSLSGNMLTDCGPLDFRGAGTDCFAVLGLAADWSLFARGAPWEGLGGTSVCGDAQTPFPWTGLTCSGNGPEAVIDVLALRNRRARACSPALWILV